jgi:hypothetical protein
MGTAMVFVRVIRRRGHGAVRLGDFEQQRHDGLGRERRVDLAEREATLGEQPDRRDLRRAHVR